MNRVALHNDLIGDDYSAAVEMMDSDDALRGRRSGSLKAKVKRSVMDILRASGVRRGSRSLRELHSSDEAEVKKSRGPQSILCSPIIAHRSPR